MNTLTLDKLHSGELLNMTHTAMGALGEDGNVEIYGNLLEGRIVINTGSNSTGKTPCRINFPDGYNLGTDNATIFIKSSEGRFFDVVAQAVESNGFEILSKELWDDNASYEFRYIIISHVQ